MIRTSEVATAVWRKSSRSQNGANNCVSVAQLEGAIAIRDSKSPNGPVLQFPSAAFTSFLRSSRMD